MSDRKWTSVEDENTQIIESLADYAHASWAGWMRYLFKNSISNGTGSVTIPVELVQRWKRQLSTLYGDLPETEKESDRDEAREILSIIRDAAMSDKGDWISVGDRLPDPDMDVDIAYISKDISYRCDNRGDWWRRLAEMHWSYQNPPAYWRQKEVDK